MLSMFLFIVLSVFLAGMMVGRTPEYLARKIETHEVKLALLTILSHPFLILVGIALFASTSWGRDTLNNPGSHGLSEIIYEFSSSPPTTVRDSKGSSTTRPLGISPPAS